MLLGLICRPYHQEAIGRTTVAVGDDVEEHRAYIREREEATPR
jgi:hypothetical protein